jgi:hypothetical protein
MCKYFDDVICDRTYAQLVAEGLVSAAEATLVEPLHALLDEHEAPDGNDSNAAGVLADPAWLAITEIAKATNLRLVALLADPSERAALLSPIEV